VGVSAFLVALLVAFGVVVLVELPDKTLVATLVLSTRYLPRPALAGVATAFAVQCAIAVTAGGMLYLLPRRAAEAAGQPRSDRGGRSGRPAGRAGRGRAGRLGGAGPDRHDRGGAGRVIVRRVPVRVVHRVAGIPFFAFAVVAVVAAVHG
jgi:putative Ca2+/H+ antiporter (TMEM165/GDT1 family)